MLTKTPFLTRLFLASVLAMSSSCAKVKQSVKDITSSQALKWDLSISRAGYGYKKADTAMYYSIIIPDSKNNTNIRTELTRDGKPVMFIVSGQGGDNWGRGDIPIGGQTTEAPLPDKIHLVFMDDFNNDQLYQLDADLPSAQMQELLTTVHRGTTDQSQRKNGKIPNVYTGFDLGFAPDGWVIFYATGIGLRKELASWQAKKIDVSPNVLDEITYGTGTKIRKSDMPNPNREELRNSQPEIYRRIESGEFKFTSGWYKRMQTKYPWNLEVTSDGSKWLGEYYMEFANTDRHNILSDQLDADKKVLKPVPTKIGTWLVETATNRKYYVEIHLFPIPKWAADNYIPYYQDPNLDFFIKRFEHFYPNHSLATNNQSVRPEDFATLKIHLNKDGKMDEIYLQKGNEKLPIDGAYEYYLAEVDPNEGGYKAKEEGFDYFVTEPKAKDLSDPAFVDLD